MLPQPIKQQSNMLQTEKVTNINFYKLQRAKRYKSFPNFVLPNVMVELCLNDHSARVTQKV